MLCVLRDVRCEVWLVIEFQHKGWLSWENTYFGVLHKITKNFQFSIIVIFLDHRLNFAGNSRFASSRDFVQE